MRIAALLVGVSLFALPATALAEDGGQVEKPKTAQASQARTPRGVVNLPPITITQWGMRPLVSVDLTRLPTRITRMVLGQRFIQRIVASIRDESL